MNEDTDWQEHRRECRVEDCWVCNRLDEALHKKLAAPDYLYGHEPDCRWRTDNPGYGPCECNAKTKRVSKIEQRAEQPHEFIGDLFDICAICRKRETYVLHRSRLYRALFDWRRKLAQIM